MNKNNNPLSMLVVTGNPKVDAIIRYALVAACAAITSHIVKWMSDHGWNVDPLVVGAAVASALVTIVFAAWGVIKASKNEAIMRLREALAVQAGINVAQSTDLTPEKVNLKTAQEVIAEYAPPIEQVKK